jgi:hypothetical protein
MQPEKILPLCLLLFLASSIGSQAATVELDVDTAGRFAELALECVHREYPNKIAHVLQGDADALPPRDLTPVFYGCYDWHSAVHGHWLLARLARALPAADFTSEARAALDQSFEAAAVATEVDYLEGPGRVSFERPYGLAWLLMLVAELRDWADDPEVQRWAFNLGPLELAAAERLADWLPKLDYPIRVGEHSQTAFAFGLILDWARIAGDMEMEELLVRKSRQFYAGDRDCPLHYEPSGQDFLSPCLAEADLMRRIFEPMAFGAWIGAFLPGIPLEGADDWLPPAVVSDPGDPKLAHLDGLNLSRAWMLEGIAAGLPAEDPRRQAILGAADRHRGAGLRSVTGEYYEGGHWLGSFATYLVTGRGLPPGPEEDDQKGKKR